MPRRIKSRSGALLVPAASDQLLALASWAHELAPEDHCPAAEAEAWVKDSGPSDHKDVWGADQVFHLGATVRFPVLDSRHFARFRTTGR
ncbi:MAG: hypothetical protein ND866_29980 [Pyrinomonadaceae bacterium]|nr:hypothetical protein [Pyrinomonadaceae bacterium]